MPPHLNQLSHALASLSVAIVGREALVVTRPVAQAADRQNDAIFVARSALKRAIAVRRDADLQVEQLRALVSQLEAESRRTVSGPLAGVAHGSQPRVR
jgi:hypothetical protein